MSSQTTFFSWLASRVHVHHQVQSHAASSKGNDLLECSIYSQMTRHVTRVKLCRKALHLLRHVVQGHPPDAAAACELGALAKSAELLSNADDDTWQAALALLQELSQHTSAMQLMRQARPLGASYVHFQPQTMLCCLPPTMPTTTQHPQTALSCIDQAMARGTAIVAEAIVVYRHPFTLVRPNCS